MQDLFLIHNLFSYSISRFKREDPQLRRLKNYRCRYTSPLVMELASQPPGIYTLAGGRQVGKSTLLKQVILYLLEKKHVPQENIYYLTGEIIENYQVLMKYLQEYFSKPDIKKESMRYIIIDEVTYINSWHRCIKFFADSGNFENTSVILTGSDIVFLKDMVKMLPGRRGKSNRTDFHFFPISFKEYLKLLKSIPLETIKKIEAGKSVQDNTQLIKKLYKELKQYLVTGGYLSAINSYAAHGEVINSVYRTYFDWIKGDILKRNKNEAYLEEILHSVAKRSGSQVTWNSLGKDVTIQHHKTIYEYCDILRSMDALFIQNALQEHKLAPALKKAKKIYFTDPFIANTICSCLGINPISDDLLVEGALITHVRRAFPTYYIKTASGGEIDLAYIESKKIIPIEIKWTENIKPIHLKWLKKYKNSILGAKVNYESTIEGIRIVPLPYLFIRHSFD